MCARRLCIGCTRCYKVCPTDAIMGARQADPRRVQGSLHRLRQCVEVCPTEAILLRPVPPTLQSWYWPKPGAVAAANEGALAA